jgi:prevent-host-death family protein
MDERPIAEARADLSELTSMVRHTGHSVMLTRRGKPQAAVVPAELAEAAEALGNEEAIKVLRQAGR